MVYMSTLVFHTSGMVLMLLNMSSCSLMKMYALGVCVRCLVSYLDLWPK